MSPIRLRRGNPPGACLPKGCSAPVRPAVRRGRLGRRKPIAGVQRARPSACPRRGGLFPRDAPPAGPPAMCLAPRGVYSPGRRAPRGDIPARIMCLPGDVAVGLGGSSEAASPGAPGRSRGGGPWASGRHPPARPPRPGSSLPGDDRPPRPAPPGARGARKK